MYLQSIAQIRDFQTVPLEPPACGAALGALGVALMMSDVLAIVILTGCLAAARRAPLLDFLLAAVILCFGDG